MESNVMESPLDVLSRAASMIETSSRTNDESTYPLTTSAVDVRPAPYPQAGTVVDLRASPGKQLPGRSARQERVHRRQIEPPGFDRLDQENDEKKSTSTQTQFSSFSCENLPPPPYYSTHDTIGQDRLKSSSALPPPPPLHQYVHDPKHASHPLPPPLHHRPPPLPSPQSRPVASPHSHLPLHYTSSSSSSTSSAILQQSHTEPVSAYHTTPPPLPPYPSSQRCSSPPHYNELCQPLNLSLSHSSSPTPDLPSSQSAPFTSRSSPVVSQDSVQSATYQERCMSQQLHKEDGGSSHETAAQVSDEAIEEHFRRSLGTCYSDVSPTKVNSTPDVPEKKCSVDDHFARALGDKKWMELKARSEHQSLETLPGSVDAHFAKALGASTWKKLKADTKMIDLGPAAQVQPQHRQQTQQTVVQSSPPHHRPLAT